MRLADLRVVDDAATPRRPPVEESRGDLPAGATAAATDPLALIDRLADLKARGILSEEEFAEKKAELLARL